MIRFVVALPSEARPIVERYRLKHQEGAWPVYIRDDVALVVSGVGKTAAAAATGFLHSRAGEQRDVPWINVGIAGHQNSSIGSAFVAHTIRSGEKCFYPPRIGITQLKAAPLVTVNQVEESFQDSALYDMEAAGFYETAIRLATAELVQCFKVVSDNRQTAWTTVSAAHAKHLITESLDTLDNLVNSLQDLAIEIRATQSKPFLLQEFLNKWRFTTSEARRLEQLLRHSEARNLTATVQDHLSATRPCDVLTKLEAQLREAPVRLT